MESIYSSKNNTSVSAIIVNYNTCELLDRAIFSLQKAKRVPEEIIVIDNASTDKSIEMLREKYPSVSVIENKENVGFGRANNQGINIATGDYIWLVNSDTEVGEGTLHELVTFMEGNSRAGAVAPQLVYEDNSLQSVGGSFPNFLNIFLWAIPLYKLLPKKIQRSIKLIGAVPREYSVSSEEIDYGTGAALLLRSSAIREIGVFDKQFFMYFEETDLCFRLWQKKWSVYVLGCSPVMHIAGGSFKNKYNEKRLYLFVGGLKIFISKNYKGLKKTLALFSVFVFIPIGLMLKKLWSHL